MINVFLNDEPVSLEKGSTVEVMVSQIGVDSADRMAVAINNQVISREAWPSYELTDQDQVLLIAPIQGG